MNMPVWLSEVHVHALPAVMHRPEVAALLRPLLLVGVLQTQAAGHSQARGWEQKSGAPCA